MLSIRQMHDLLPARTGAVRREGARRCSTRCTGEGAARARILAAMHEPEALQVVTVRGPIDPGELGVTLSHDHVLMDGWDIFKSYAVILDDEETAIAELVRYRVAGGNAICDPTNGGLKRNPTALRRISEESGVHIVMGAGWYRERVYPPEIATTSTNDLADLLVRELTAGVGDTGIRPGFIGEIGTERGVITPAEERVFRAAARASVRTGCPILTHTTHSGELALEQMALLGEEGISADRVIISHLGDRRERRGLLGIAASGAWLSVDNLAFVAGYSPLSVRADNVAMLWAEGFGDRILLGNDICEVDALAVNGGVGYANVIQAFWPLLHERGITDEQFHAMTVGNPARAYAYPAEAAAVAAEAAARVAPVAAGTAGPSHRTAMDVAVP
jgi:predicted metal-dependent phosphotriesterase family hydrolase